MPVATLTRTLLRLAAAVLGGGAALLTPVAARAHPAAISAAAATIEPDGGFRVSAQFDLLAFALNDTSARIGNEPMEELLHGPAEVLAARLANARERFLHGLRVTTDRGPGQVDACRFPTAEQVAAWDANGEAALPIVMSVELAGRLPANAGTVAFRFPDILEQVILTVERPGEEPWTEPVEAGETSTALPVKVTPTSPPPPRPGTLRRIGRYVRLGIRHILPGGLDHILFILGLFLFNPRARPLLWQVTAFTVAHTFTLGLSLYGWVRVAPAVIDPLVWLSIAYVAVENLRTTEFRAGRLLVVFLFGLLHGLGFATALIDLGLPRRDFLEALIGFNCGVEVGQVTVIAAVAPTLLSLRPWAYYRAAVVYPLSIGIAVLAIFWTVRRFV